MSKQREIDITKGYRIHFNALVHSDVLPTFHQAHAGTPRQHSRWYLNEPDLADRESVQVKTMQEFLRTMQTRDHTRLADSVILYGTHAPIPMADFFVHGNKRLSGLYNRVGKITGGDLVPCMILFKAAEDKTVGLWRDRKDAQGNKNGSYRDLWVKGQRIHEDGKNIDFELYYNYLRADARSTVRIEKGQLLLVTGMAERSFASASRETVRVHVDHEDAAYTLIHGTKELLTAPPTAEVAQADPMAGFFTSRFD